MGVKEKLSGYGREAKKKVVAVKDTAIEATVTVGKMTVTPAKLVGGMEAMRLGSSRFLQELPQPDNEINTVGAIIVTAFGLGVVLKAIADYKVRPREVSSSSLSYQRLKEIEDQELFRVRQQRTQKVIFYAREGKVRPSS